MKISVTDARRKLPELVRRVKEDDGLRVLITVHGDTVAELRAHAPEPPPGEAARKLQRVMAGLPPHRGRKRRVSERVNEVLYGDGSE